MLFHDSEITESFMILKGHSSQLVTQGLNHMLQLWVSSGWMVDHSAFSLGYANALWIY